MSLHPCRDPKSGQLLLHDKHSNCHADGRLIPRHAHFAHAIIKRPQDPFIEPYIFALNSPKAKPVGCLLAIM
jgi:hypothetical protein